MIGTGKRELTRSPPLRENAYIPCVGVLIFLYVLLPPWVRAQTFFEIQDYKQLFPLSPDYLFLATFSALPIVIYSSLLTKGFVNDILKISSDDIKSIKIISIVLLSVLFVNSAPLWMEIYSGVTANRTESFDIIANLRHNPASSVLITLTLACTATLLIWGHKAFIAAFFFIATAPEMAFGTRITLFRLMIILIFISFLLGAATKIKTILLLLLLSLLVISVRVIFNDYSVSGSFNILIVVLGDMMNVYTGTNALINSPNTHLLQCGMDGIHVLRWLVPPYLGMREALGAPEDVTVCINELGFLSGLSPGHGGSPTNDIYAFPITFLLSSILLMVLVGTISLLRISYIRIISYMALFSLIPYFFRNGFIVTANHAATIYIWVILPLYILLDLFKQMWSHCRQTLLGKTFKRE